MVAGSMTEGRETSVVQVVADADVGNGEYERWILRILQQFANIVTCDAFLNFTQTMAATPKKIKRNLASGNQQNRALQSQVQLGLVLAK